MWPSCLVPASDNRPAPGVILRDIIEDLEGALEQLRLIAEDVGTDEADEA